MDWRDIRDEFAPLGNYNDSAGDAKWVVSPLPGYHAYKRAQVGSDQMKVERAAVPVITDSSEISSAAVVVEEVQHLEGGPSEEENAKETSLTWQKLLRRSKRLTELCRTRSLRGCTIH